VEKDNYIDNRIVDLVEEISASPFLKIDVSGLCLPSASEI
jgi:hypothetical protein